ncbi:MAG: anaerobic ribonucleoside-triphosphate reductase activating protein [Spirochaetes bacterium]|jgi:pyruvate formate lyase activating enzyme|nr:anaerobic ribonucleoside-triphosphate reductase activating protein [Spirochaetota bacterium]
MNFKGIHKTSLVDFPGKLSTVLFAGGCNLNCRYCYNPELVNNNKELETLKVPDILSFLKKRQALIQGVVISGGEPTLLKNLDKFIESVKEISLAVKIDTNGLNPDIIQTLLQKGLVDYIAIDIKTSPEKYESLTRKKNVDFSLIKKTIDHVKKSGVDYEIRTTCIPDYITLDDFKSIKKELGSVKKYFLQQFVNKMTLDPDMQKKTPYPVSVLNSFKEFVITFAEHCELRGV